MFLGLRNKIIYLYNSFLNLVFDKKCIVCGCSKSDNLLCKTCAKDVNYLSGFPHKIYNGIPIYSASLYQTTVKELIHKLKFKHKKSAAIVLSKILFNYFKKIKEEDKEYIITFVPSFYLKSYERGYNHMYLISKEFSKLTGINIEQNLINKIKYTKPQYKVKDRYKNIKNSIKINKSKILLPDIKEKTIILLDDITTSGATVEEVLNCFLKENINNIICLTVAKA